MSYRFLTKSRFKLATECPTKLFYTGKTIYPDKSVEDAFLEALAEGGFQIGELAKAYYPEGHDVKSLDYETALAETNKLLELENITIFEAAILYNNLFIRVDILQKQDNVISLIEVKAKSFNAEDDFISKRNKRISKKWRPYMIDVAFQDYVIRKAFPEMRIQPYLMLADKNTRTSINGLNQKFKIGNTSKGRKQAWMEGDVSKTALGNKILKKVDVSKYVHELQEDQYEVNGNHYDFEGYVHFLSSAYAKEEKVVPEINCTTCAECQFRATNEEEKKGKISGYKECWMEILGFTESDFKTPSVLDIWDFRKKQDFLEENRFFLKELNEDDFDLSKTNQTRQWLQVQKSVANDVTPWIDVEGLSSEMSSWVWPLHFIDFETSAVAIPFTKDRHPYEVVAFQFSHHIAYKDGHIEHVDEYLNVEPGVFPNFEFVRRLKLSLEKDNGTIFRYAPHENTVLNQIIQQIETSKADIPDYKELISWLKTITRNSKTEWVGQRAMVDMWELVKKYYFQLEMGGSNSIKKVLPAMLNSSEYLQEKYSQPIYNSHNFQNQIWVEKDEYGKVKDPYKLLDPIFDDIDREQMENFTTDSKLADGGAAMTAYARLQFSDIPEVEREATQQALLRYCELDTLAMVMIWEDWNNMMRSI